MSRHRRQPSCALPLDFNIDGDKDQAPAVAAKGGATSIDGSQQNPRAGGSWDAAAGASKGQEGQTTTKKPPPATTGTGGNKPRQDDGSGGHSTIDRVQDRHDGGG